jgi:MYXO-CTERM domain-containing protein
MRKTSLIVPLVLVLGTGAFAAQQTPSDPGAGQAGSYRGDDDGPGMGWLGLLGLAGLLGLRRRAPETYPTDTRTAAAR